MAAPACAAPSADSAISAAVTGKCDDIDGVWIDPVTAQEMITLCDAMIRLSACKYPGDDRQDAYLWKFGSRFSLNAVTPSFDSAVS